MYEKNYVYYDLAYGSRPRQKMDLFLPKSCSGETGLILFIHGGGWVEGDKECYNGELEYWSSLGYAAMAINYDYISDQVHVNTLLDDITLALQKAKETASEKGVELKKMLLTGASAGGHLAELYGYSCAEIAPVKPAAIVSFCGVADLTSLALLFESQLGDDAFLANLLSQLSGYLFTSDARETAKLALQLYSPVFHVNASSVPTVICHGVKDELVPYETAVQLDQKLTECGVTHDFITFPNSGHGLDQDEDCMARARELFREYAQTYLK